MSQFIWLSPLSISSAFFLFIAACNSRSLASTWRRLLSRISLKIILFSSEMFNLKNCLPFVKERDSNHDHANEQYHQKCFEISEYFEQFRVE